LTDNSSNVRRTLLHEARHAANSIGKEANPQAHAAAVEALQNSPQLLKAAAKKYPGFKNLNPERQLSEVLSMMADGKLDARTIPSEIMRFVESVLAVLRGSVLVSEVSEISGYFADLSSILEQNPVAPAETTPAATPVIATETARAALDMLPPNSEGRADIINTLTPEQKKELGVEDEATGVGAETAPTLGPTSSAVRGDRFVDETGQEFEVWKNRQGTVEAMPVVDGKPMVNNQSGVRFSVTEAAASRNPDDRRSAAMQEETSEASIDPFPVDPIPLEASAGQPLYVQAGTNAQMSAQMQSSLVTAQIMHAEGRTSEEIRAVTGWHVNPYDKMLRWEISDNQARFVDQKQFAAKATEVYGGEVFNSLPLSSAIDRINSGEVVRLGDVFTHDALYQAYPDAANIPFFPIGGNVASGSFRVVDGKEMITATLTSDSDGNISDESVSTVLHELQHFIQRREGFAPGGSADNLVTKADILDAGKFREAYIELNNYEKELGNLANALAEERAKKSFVGLGGPNAKRIQSIETAISNINKAVNRIWDYQSKKLSIDRGSARAAIVSALVRVDAELGSSWVLNNRAAGLNKVYQLLAGEIEARDVQARRDMTDEERQSTAPYSSENIAPETAIVMQGAANAQMSDATDTESSWSATIADMVDRAIAKYPNVKATVNRSIATPARAVGLSIELNPVEMAAYTDGMSEADAAATIDKVFRHEATHRHAVAEVGDDVVVAYANAMTADERLDVASHYLHRSAYPTDEAWQKAVDEFTGDLPNISAGERRVRRYRLGHEALRMRVERFTTGFTTEEDYAFLQTNPSNFARFTRYLKAYLNRLREWYAARKDPVIGVEVRRLARLLKTIEEGPQVSRGEAPFSLATRPRLQSAGRPVMIQPPRSALDVSAYHGTPHKWSPETLWRLSDGRTEWIVDGDPVPSGSTPVRKAPAGRVRADRVGSGEGAAAYGWGVLYVAESEGVARFYRDTLTPKSGTGKRWKWNQQYQFSDVDNVLSEDDGWNTKAELVSLLRNKAGRFENEWGDSQPENDYQMAVDLIESGKIEIVERDPGNLYAVELKVDQDLLLDWDKPLSEQSEKTRNLLGERWTALDQAREENNPGMRPATGGDFYGDMEETLADELDERQDSTQANRASSEKLRALGIQGIRYLDGNSRGKDEGNYNYVIFDPELIEVTGVNGEPVSQEVRDEALGGPPLEAARRGIFNRPKKGKYVSGGIATAANWWDARLYKMLESVRGAYKADMKFVEWVAKDIIKLTKKAFKADVTAGMALVNRALGNVENRLTEADVAAIKDIKKKGLAAAQSIYMTERAKATAVEASGDREKAALIRQDARIAFDNDVKSYKARAEAYETKARSDARDKAKVDRQDALDQLPDELKDKVENLRSRIDQLSNRMMSEGNLTKELKATIDENRGLWLHRSYEIFDDPNYKEWINEQRDPEAIRRRNNAVNFIRQDLITRKTAELIASGVPAPQAVIDARTAITDAQVQDVFDDYLMVADNGSKHLITGKTVSKETAAVMKRGTIPQQIQELWGRYDDPAVNAVKSISAVSQFLSINKFFTEVLALGKSEGWLVDPSTGALKQDRQGTRLVPLFENNGKTGSFGNTASNQYSPLAGYWGPENLAKALEQTVNDRNSKGLMGAFAWLTGYAMWAATAGSIGSRSRNFIGNTMPAAVNGNITVNPVTWLKASRLARIHMTGGIYVGWKATKAERDEAEKLVRLGVFGDTVTVNIISQLTGKANRNQRPIGLKGRSKIIRFLDKTIANPAAAIKDWAGDEYAIPDEIWKYINYQAEVERVASYRPGATQEEIEAEAAELVKKLTFTYSRAPEFIKRLREQPVIAPFVTFPAETVRVTYNQAAVGISQIAEGTRTGNSKLAIAGYKRVLVAGSVAAVAYAFPAMIRALWGFSLKDEDDLREHVAEWRKNSTLLIMDDDRSKGVRYADVSYGNPYDTVIRWLRSVSRNIRDGDKDGFEIGWEAATELLDPILSEQILFSTVMDARNGETANGIRIWEKNDSDAVKLAKSAKYVTQQALTPGTVKSGLSIADAAKGVVSRTGKAPSMTDELVALLGPRVTTHDFYTSMRIAGGQFRSEELDAKAVFTRAIKSRGTQDEQDILAAYNNANQLRLAAYSNMREKYLSAISLRTMTREDAIKVMRDAGLTKTQISDITRNRISRIELSRESLLDARREGRKLGQDREAIYRKARELVPSTQPITLDDQ
jgi:hypothetical protein